MPVVSCPNTGFACFSWRASKAAKFTLPRVECRRFSLSAGPAPIPVESRSTHFLYLPPRFQRPHVPVKKEGMGRCAGDGGTVLFCTLRLEVCCAFGAEKGFCGPFTRHPCYLPQSPYPLATRAKNAGEGQKVAGTGRLLHRKHASGLRDSNSSRD